MEIKCQIQENIEARVYTSSKFIPYYKETRIKQIWGLKEDLTKVNWLKYITRKNSIWSPKVDWVKCNIDGCSKGNPGLAVLEVSYETTKGIF